MSEDLNNWSLTEAPGALRIIAHRLPGGDAENLLIRPAPDRGSEVTTVLRFQPTSNSQFAGVVVYESPFEYL